MSTRWPWSAGRPFLAGCQRRRQRGSRRRSHCPDTAAPLRLCSAALLGRGLGRPVGWHSRQVRCFRPSASPGWRKADTRCLFKLIFFLNQAPVVCFKNYFHTLIAGFILVFHLNSNLKISSFTRLLSHSSTPIPVGVYGLDFLTNCAQNPVM